MIDRPEAQCETPRAAQENIEAVAQLERGFRNERTPSQRVADRIADLAGSIRFAVFHVLWFALWILINTGAFREISPFDPYPFILLSLIVSCEAVLLSTFVLVKQNRMSRAADQRAHLNLQIDLLAEREITKILQMQWLICRRLGIEEVLQDREAKDLSTETAVEKLATEVREGIPTD